MVKYFFITFCMAAWMSFNVGNCAGQYIGLGWDLADTDQYGTSPCMPDSQYCAFTGVQLARGSGVLTSGVAASGAWGGRGFTSTCADSAIQRGQFFTISWVWDSDTLPYLSHIQSYNIRRSATGPNRAQWEFAINQEPFRVLTDSHFIGSNTSASGNPQPRVSLHKIATHKPPPKRGDTLRLRYILWGGTANTGACYFNNTQEEYGLSVLFSYPINWIGSVIDSSSGNSLYNWTDTANWSTHNTHSPPTSYNSAVLHSSPGIIQLPDTTFASLIHIKKSSFHFFPNPNSMVFSDWKLDSAVQLSFFDSSANTNQTLTIRGHFWVDPNGATQIHTMQGSRLSRLNIAPLHTSHVTFEAPISVQGSGIASVAATGSGGNQVQFHAPILGNGNRLCVGATGSNTLILNNIDNAAGPVRIAAGLTGGTGTLIVKGDQNHWGDTEMNNASSGQLLLEGGNNRLPITTTLKFGVNSHLGNSTLDLNGTDQEVAQIGNMVQNGGVITNDRAHTTSILKLSGTDSTLKFSGFILDGAGRIGLHRTGLGTTQLTQSCSYTGPTIVDSGCLKLSSPKPSTLHHQSKLILNGGVLHIAGNQASDSVYLLGGELHIDSGVCFTIHHHLCLKNTLITGKGFIQYKSHATLLYTSTFSRQTGLEWPIDSVPYSVTINTPDTVQIVFTHTQHRTHELALNQGSVHLKGNSLFCNRILGGGPNQYVSLGPQGKVSVVLDSIPMLIPLQGLYYNPVTLKNLNVNEVRISVLHMDSLLDRGTSGSPVSGNVVPATWLISSPDHTQDKGLDIQFRWDTNQESGTVSNPVVHALNSQNNWTPIASVADDNKIQVEGYRGVLSAFSIIDAASMLPLCHLEVQADRKSKGHWLEIGGNMSIEAHFGSELELAVDLLENGKPQQAYRKPVLWSTDATFNQRVFIQNPYIREITIYLLHDSADTLCLQNLNLTHSAQPIHPLVYPVPTREYFKVRSTLPSVLNFCVVYSVHGKELCTLNPKQATHIGAGQIEHLFNVQHLESGIYQLALHFASGVQYHKMVIH